jgi:hypothetical protein
MGALEPDLDGVSDGLGQQRGVGRWLVGGALPGPANRCADDMVTDPFGQPDDQVVAGGDLDQLGRLDGLEVAGGDGRHDHGLGRWVGAALLGLQVVSRVDVVDDLKGLALDLAHDGVNLNGAGQVVDEVDEHPHADQGQAEGSGDGQPGHEGLLAAALDAHGAQPGGAVGKGADKDAEDHLGAAVAHEVAQQPGEYWPEAICRATMVRAKTSPVTVIMVVETTMSTLRASSAVPWKARAARGESSLIDTRDSSAPAARKTTTDSVGRTQRAPAR